MKINSKLFTFSFFLSDRIKVNSLEEGAILYGGATRFNDDSIYSNIEGNEYIEINPLNNEISIFIPSTLEGDKQIDNSKYVKYAINYLGRYYDITKLKYYNSKGSWYSDNLNKVIIESITIVTLTKKELTEIDINIFIDLANSIKHMMKQEGVSIAINTALAIV